MSDRQPPEGRVLFRFKPPEMTRRQRAMTDVYEEYVVVALEDHEIESSECLVPHNSVVIYGWLSWKQDWEANVSARPVVYELLKMARRCQRLMRDNDPGFSFWTPGADLVLPGETSGGVEVPEHLRPELLEKLEKDRATVAAIAAAEPELRCSGCGWEGSASDLIDVGPDDPPECPLCDLPFEGLDDVCADDGGSPGLAWRTGK